MTTHIELLDGRVVVDQEELLSRCKATKHDVAVLSGTLLEGFGNLYSDLDLYVICEQLPTRPPDSSSRLVGREDGRVRRVNEVLKGAADIVLDIQYYTYRELDTLSRSLNTLYFEARQSTQIFRKTLHLEDEDLIHKLLTGRILKDGGSGFEAGSLFQRPKFCFLKYRNDVGGYAEFRDLVGSWSDGDTNTCLFNARGYLISHVSGMMFLAGHTNPRPKWFMRKLQLLNAEYADVQVGLREWLSTPYRTESDRRYAIESACNLIDETHSHTRRLLNENPIYFSVEEALALTEQEFSERGVNDPDTLAERRLRRSIFSGSEDSLWCQLMRPGREPFTAGFYANTTPKGDRPEALT